MGKVIHAAESFSEPYGLAKEQQEYWGCIDERAARLKNFRKKHVTRTGRRLTLIDYRRRQARYHGTAGGAVGVGQDVTVARILGASRVSTKNAVDIRPLENAERARAKAAGEAPQISFRGAHILGSVSVKAARNYGVNIFNHEECAAEANAPTIAAGIVSNRGPKGENIYATIKDHWSKDGRRATLPESRFKQIQEAFAAAVAEGAIASPDISIPVHDEGAIIENTTELLPIPRVPLADIPHYADTHLIEWRPDMIYNREAAQDASNFEDEDGIAYGAYQTSMGSAGNLHGAIADVIPIDRNDFTDAMFVRNAATSLYLPRQHSAEIPTQLQNVG